MSPSSEICVNQALYACPYSYACVVMKLTMLILNVINKRTTVTLGTADNAESIFIVSKNIRLLIATYSS